MEQKSYKLEIVNELLNAEYHIRELARRLNTNHMIIVRKIKELYKENIVDYKREGKNNKYFLKKTIEAKSFAFSAENYKLNKLLKKYPSLRRIIEKIQTNKDIKLAILFGSYAKEIAKVNSDIDVYIETDSKKIREDINSIDSKLSVKIGKYDKSNLLIKEIEKNHVVIKGIEAYYEKNKFVESSEELKQSYIIKSESNLISAKILLNNDKFEESVGLAYYSMYHLLTALLFKIGIKSENHSASIIIDAKKERIDKQYYVDFVVTKEDVKDTIRKAEIFNSKLINFISKINNEDIKIYRKKFIDMIK